jgi:hypothetical protein
MSFLLSSFSCFCSPGLKAHQTFGHRILRISYVPPAKLLTLTSTEREKGIYSSLLDVILIIFSRVVDFESSDDVTNAIRKLDGSELKGKRVRLTDDPVRHLPPPKNPKLIGALECNY